MTYQTNAPPWTKGRVALITGQILVTILFIWNTQLAQNNTIVGWAVPLLLVVLVMVNSFWFSRITSWIIFAVGFFSFCILLSAFTIRWRAESGFDSSPFYRSLIMYALFVYVGLGQLKILGRNLK